MIFPVQKQEKLFLFVEIKFYAVYECLFVYISILIVTAHL